MKVKQQPEDFVVTEVADIQFQPAGRFAIYRLSKLNWTTHDALDVIRQRLKVDRERISYGGLKDRHAETSQYITIYNGIPRNLEHQRLRLEYLGQVREPFTSEQIQANRFQVTIRGLTRDDVQRAECNLPAVSEFGVPNYFDDQRFGSVGEDRKFIVGELVHGRFEEALRLALANPYEHDRAEEKEIKAAVRKFWGNWPECKAALPRSSTRSIIDYLVYHPTDYKGAFIRLKPELTSLYLSAYQSDLWNRMLARWLTRACSKEQLDEVPLKFGPMPAPKLLPTDLRAKWESLSFPLPSARIKAQEGAEWYESLQPVLTEEGLTLEQVRIRGVDKPYFSKGERKICLKPFGLRHSSSHDELNANRQKLILEFELPRAAYATMVIKRILQSE
jgi:tRNA pseudouridine13 synthase